VEIKTSDHMVVRSFEVFRENVCSIHTGDIIFAFGRVGSVCGYAILVCSTVHHFHALVIMINPLFSTFDVGKQGQPTVPLLI